MTVPEVSMSTLVDEVRHDESTTLARLTVDQYHRMNEFGILPDGSPIELIDGVLVLKDRRDAGGDPMTHGPRHSFVVQSIRNVVDPLVRPHGFHARTQAPITIPPDSEPEPDVAVVRGSLRDYADRHPGPADVPLVVEVAFSSLSRDRRIKARLYAAAGCQAYWIVDLRSQRVEVYRDPIPAEGRYRDVRSHGPDEKVAFALTKETSVEVAVSDFLM
ncbi:MAG TPA: Uma2 family endonuclease [Planctomycetaceae bacterium]